MTELSDIFGGAKLSMEEFCARCAEMGVEIGDIGALRADYEAAMHALRCEQAVETALDEAGVKNRALVKKLIDMDALTFSEDGAIVGLAEQIEALRQSDGYLFAEKASGAPKLRMGLSHRGRAADPEAMTDTDFYRSIKKLG